MQRPALTRTTSVMTNEPVKKTAESVIKSIPESKIKEHDKPFNEVWGFPQDIIKTIQSSTRPVTRFYQANLNILRVAINLFAFSTIRIIRCLPNIWRCNW